MTAPLAHPLRGAPMTPAAGRRAPIGDDVEEDVSDARLKSALQLLAAIIRRDGLAAMPLFEKLEAEYDRRSAERDRLDRFLKED